MQFKKFLGNRKLLTTGQREQTIRHVLWVVGIVEFATLFNDVTIIDYIANNFVIDVYCRCL